ncbi:hypothetical protein AMTR_s00003p00259740 [Amborella trichopoda]|uniref:Uncharacterized protein n=1 Tax=Amborella trichopoda TaxID=13333 RepID=W1P735_AMBTC|nr:hypothetical protein AMTR_s00003p00259740 [Amborella trichopoda]
MQKVHLNKSTAEFHREIRALKMWARLLGKSRHRWLMCPSSRTPPWTPFKCLFHSRPPHQLTRVHPRCLFPYPAMRGPRKKHMTCGSYELPVADVEHNWVPLVITWKMQRGTTVVPTTTTLLLFGQINGVERVADVHALSFSPANE